MSDPAVLFEATLKNRGLSVTEARRTVFDALQGQEPQSIAELVKACGGAIDRTSIYRAITLFEQLGIVKRLQMGWKYKLELSDAFQRHHHHLTCNRCGRIIPLPEDPQLEERLGQLVDELDFDMRDHQLEVQGYCASCRAA